MLVRSVILLLASFSFSGCPFDNPGQAKSDRTYSSVADAPELKFANGTGSPPSRTVYWGNITISGDPVNGSPGPVLMTISQAGITLVLNSNGQCAATFEGSISGLGWVTDANFNGRNGQKIIIRIRDSQTGLVHPYPVGEFQVKCKDRNVVIDNYPILFDASVYQDNTSAEFVVEPYPWQKCVNSKATITGQPARHEENASKHNK